MDEERLLSHIEWLRGDHELYNPFLADDIQKIIDERNELLNQKDSFLHTIDVLENRLLLG